MHSAMDDHKWPGFPIQKSTDRSLFASSPWLIAGYNVFHRLSMPRHPPYALSSFINPTSNRQQNRRPSVKFTRWTDLSNDPSRHLSPHTRGDVLWSDASRASTSKTLALGVTTIQQHQRHSSTCQRACSDGSEPASPAWPVRLSRGCGPGIMGAFLGA